MLQKVWRRSVQSRSIVRLFDAMCGNTTLHTVYLHNLSHMPYEDTKLVGEAIARALRHSQITTLNPIINRFEDDTVLAMVAAIESRRGAVNELSFSEFNHVGAAKNEIMERLRAVGSRFSF